MKDPNLKPIGFIRTLKDQVATGKAATSEIVIDEDLTEALEGIEQFSHMFVLYLFHLADESDRNVLKAHPQNREDLPLVGVFVTRGAKRPNPIGLTLVEIIERKKNILTVKGLDAEDNSPVLDIKPYDQLDIAQRARMPDWWPVVDW